MRRRKWRRLLNRNALRGALQSAKIKTDYRSFSLGGKAGDKAEEKILVLLIAIGTVLLIGSFLSN